MIAQFMGKSIFFLTEFEIPKGKQRTPRGGEGLWSIFGPAACSRFGEVFAGKYLSMAVERRECAKA